MTLNDSLFPRDLSAIDQYLLRDEESARRDLLAAVDAHPVNRDVVFAHAATLIEHIRKSSTNSIGVESMLREYSLSETEGILLMCLAESLLRVPDALTADRLIADKLLSGAWGEYVGKGESWLLNASSWGLFLTGRFLELGRKERANAIDTVQKTVRRLGEPVIRASVKVAMQVMGKQFVLGENLGDAFKKAKSWESQGYRYSYDMLGEGARTMRDADRYFDAYEDAIHKIAKQSGGRGPVDGPGISIKLSAIHPRYQFSQDDRVQSEVFERLMALAEIAKAGDVNLTVDAEEADRLTLSMRLIQRVMNDGGLGDWNGFGLAVQAYHKATPVVLNFLRDLAESNKRKMMVRLVKGAYWDYEIKHAQEGGYADFPVYTRKYTTDVSYQACAAQLLNDRDWIFPQFATHNAITAATILNLTDNYEGFEFQRLHGMGEHMFEGLRENGIYEGPVRIYAPVGEHEHLLAYLVRRLLENGANSSFVNKVSDPDFPVESLLNDPVTQLREVENAKHDKIELPARIYGTRTNSSGWNLETSADQTIAYSELAEAKDRLIALAKSEFSGEEYHVVNPSDVRAPLAITKLMSVEECRAALTELDPSGWAAMGSAARAAMMFRVGDLLEKHKAELTGLLITEAGKLVSDADAEIREAIDFCRYYAMDAEKSSGKSPLGVVLCISPWNFPLAIFLGQVAAALGAGNTVIAKPSEQAMLIAKRTVELCYQAGVPKTALQLAMTDGATAGEAFLSDERVAGITFTGSTATAQHIQKTVAKRGGRMPVMVAETGGQNGMVVDSTALPEQVTDDVIRSGFQSAGQRCSALRVLYVQEDVADTVIEMIIGAMKELKIGNPANADIDVGPVIDDKALGRLTAHRDFMAQKGKLLYSCTLPRECEHGYFFAPALYEIDSIGVLPGEVFGPVVHVVRYKASEFSKVFDRINSTGFGLTMGIHSRIDDHVRQAVKASHAGNIYVNRNIIGAVVGVQPFGGAGLSGTGPKAGGPNYLSRFLDYAPLTAQTVEYSTEVDLVDPVKGLKSWRELTLDERWDQLKRVEGEPVTIHSWAKDQLELIDVMPGPTGEQNTLELRARGRVWIDPNIPFEQAHSLLTLALLAGNVCGVAANYPLPEAWRPLVARGAIEQVVLADRSAHAQLLGSGRFEVIVMAPEDELVAATSAVEGSLPIIVDSYDQHLALQRFAHEVTVSINTTAAGGNAALMADID